MKKKLFYSFLLLFFIACSGKSKIVEVQIEGLNEKDSVILAYYLGEKLYPKDTVFPDQNGQITYKKWEKAEPGMYAFVVNTQDSSKATLVDFIFNEEKKIIFKTKAGNNQSVPNMQVEISEENKIFYDYLKFINQQKEKMAALELQKQDFSAGQEQIEEQMKAINEEVLAKQTALSKGDLYVNKMLKLSFDLPLPTPPVEETDVQKWQFDYYKEHYWDRMDFKDHFLGNNALFEKKLNHYFEFLVPQDLTIVKEEIQHLIGKIDAGTSIYRVVLFNLLSRYQMPSAVCMDEIFSFLVDEYIKTGKAFWLTEEVVGKIIEFADNIKTISCGQTAPDIKLLDPSQTKWMSLHEIKAEYTILAFWSNQCGHCVREMPVLAQKIKKFSPDFAKVYAVEVEVETENWIKFLNEHPEVKQTFINVSDNPQMREKPVDFMNNTTLNSLNFRKVYAIYATPTFFLLDKDKKILYKNLTVEALDQVLNNFWNEKKTKTAKK